MNGSLLNIHQSMPNSGTGPSLKGGKGAVASESDGIGFAAFLAGLVPTDASPECANILSHDLIGDEQTDMVDANAFQKLMSLAVESPMVAESDLIAVGEDVAAVEDSSVATKGTITRQAVELLFGNFGSQDSDKAEVTQLLKSVDATLQSFTPNEADIDGEIAVDSKTTYSLQLKLYDRSITLPIVVGDAPDSNPKVLSIMTDGRLTFDSANIETTDLRDLGAAIGKIIPIEAQKSVNLRPEVAVRQVITVADPQTFVKQYLTELIPGLTQGNSVSKETETSKQPQSPERIAPATLSIKSMQSAQTAAANGDFNTKSNDQHLDARRSDKENMHQIHANGDDKTSNKLDMDKLVRLTTGTSEPGSKETSGLIHTSDVPQSTEMSIRPSAQPIPVAQSAQAGAPLSQNIPDESVGFKVILPDAQMKVADMSTFKISIQPESLGQVKVHLAVIDDHLTARLSVESSAAKHLVETHLPTLRETLHQHGIKVESFAVNVADRDNPNRQFDQRREPLSQKSKGAEFSLDSFDRSEVPVVAPSVSRGANLTGQLNLVA